MKIEEWEEWSNSPLTKEFRESVVRELEEMAQDGRLSPMFHPDSVDRTALATAHRAGLVEGAEVVLGMMDEYKGNVPV